MNGSLRPWLLIAALLFALALPSAGGAAGSGATFQVSAGTLVDSSGTLLSPAWEIVGPTSSFGATVSGPGGLSHRIGGAVQRFPGMPDTLAINWCFECNVTYPGAWSATGDDGSQTSFSIDKSSHLTPIQLDSRSFVGGTQTVSASWTAGSDAASFIAYVQPTSSTSATTWTAGRILPGSARSVSFSGLSLSPATAYSLDVFAFSSDVTSDTLPAVFNVASDQVAFRPGSAGNQALGCCSFTGCCIDDVPIAQLRPVTKFEWKSVLNDWLEHKTFAKSHTCAAVVVARTHAPPAFKEGTPLVHALDLYEIARCKSPGDASGIRAGMSDRQVADLARVPVPWLSGQHKWFYRKPGEGVTVIFNDAGHVDRVVRVVTLGVAAVALPPP